MMGAAGLTAAVPSSSSSPPPPGAVTSGRAGAEREAPPPPAANKSPRAPSGPQRRARRLPTRPARPGPQPQVRTGAAPAARPQHPTPPARGEGAQRTERTEGCGPAGGRGSVLPGGRRGTGGHGGRGGKTEEEGKVWPRGQNHRTSPSGPGAGGDAHREVPTPALRSLSPCAAVALPFSADNFGEPAGPRDGVPSLSSGRSSERCRSPNPAGGGGAARWWALGTTCGCCQEAAIAGEAPEQPLEFLSRTQRGAGMQGGLCRAGRCRSCPLWGWLWGCCCSSLL